MGHIGQVITSGIVFDTKLLIIFISVFTYMIGNSRIRPSCLREDEARFSFTYLIPHRLSSYIYPLFHHSAVRGEPPVGNLVQGLEACAGKIPDLLYILKG